MHHLVSSNMNGDKCQNVGTFEKPFECTAGSVVGYTRRIRLEIALSFLAFHLAAYYVADDGGDFQATET